MPNEVKAWPEGTLYWFSAGQSNAPIQTYVENISLTVSYEYVRLRTHQPTAAMWGNRGTFILGDKKVSVDFGQMWSDSTAMLRSNSASAWNFSFSASGIAIETGAWAVWSAVFTQFEHEGRENGLFRTRASIAALDFSGL